MMIPMEKEHISSTKNKKIGVAKFHDFGEEEPKSAQSGEALEKVVNARACAHHAIVVHVPKQPE